GASKNKIDRNVSVSAPRSASGNRASRGAPSSQTTAIALLVVPKSRPTALTFSLIRSIASFTHDRVRPIHCQRGANRIYLPNPQDDYLSSAKILSARRPVRTFGSAI